MTLEPSGSLPVLAYERVLGAEIAVNQRDIARAAGGWVPKRGEPVRVLATGRDRSYITSRERRYIAEWARRNLFGGARPGAGSCPSCGAAGGGDGVLAPGQRWCGSGDCRVVSFREGGDG